MHKILLVDDERSILDLLEMVLKREQFQVAKASDGKSAMALFDSFNPDLVLLDLMLPDANGHDLCREMTKKRKVLIIMLTAKNDIIDKVLGLELGADDYITKPFDTRELIARIKAVLRRFEKKEADDSKILRHLDLVINLKNRTVTKRSKFIELTLKDRGKVFDRFYRTENTRGFSGTGVGLSIAKHIVDAHKGQIKLTEGVGGGTTVILKFRAENELLQH